MRLKNWSITSDCSSCIMPAHFNLQGYVYDHPRFNDGDPVTTSRIIEINDKGDHKEAITWSGSVYELYKEDVDEMAERQYPNYYERLCLKEGE